LARAMVLRARWTSPSSSWVRLLRPRRRGMTVLDQTSCNERTKEPTPDENSFRRRHTPSSPDAQPSLIELHRTVPARRARRARGSGRSQLGRITTGGVAVNRAMRPDEPCAFNQLLGGEDFAFYQQRISGCFAFIGVSHADWQTQHNVHPRNSKSTSLRSRSERHCTWPWRSRRSQPESRSARRLRRTVHGIACSPRNATREVT